MVSFDPNQGKDPGDSPLNSVRPFVPRYGGRVLSNESYDVLFNLIYKDFDLEAGFKTTAEEKKSIMSIGAPVDVLERDCLAAISNIKFGKRKELNNAEKRSFFEKLKEIACKIDDFSESAWEEYQSNYSNDIDESKTFEEIRKSVFPIILKKFLYKLGYVIPREDCTTDISGVISSITPTPERVQEAFRRIGSMFLEGTLLEIDDDERDKLVSAIIPEEEYESFCTTLSPFLLRSIIYELDNLRVSFFDRVKACITVSKEDLISALIDYEDMGLSSEAILDDVSITQNGYDVVVVWDNPALLTREIIKYQEEFEKMVQPIKNLLRDLGGDLKVSLDKFELRIVISCPKQEELDFSINDLTPDIVIFGLTQGEEVIYPDTTLVRVRIPCVNGITELTMCKIFLSKEANREKTIKLLSYLDELNKNQSLTKMSVYSRNGADETNITLRYHNAGAGEISDMDGTTIRFSVDGNIDEETVALITSTVELSNKSYFEIAEVDLSTLNILLKSLHSVVKKVEAIDSGEKSYFLEDRGNGSFSLEVDDLEGNIIVNAVFRDGNFCGRCHAPELTDMVLEVYESIIDSEQFKDGDFSNPIPPFLIIDEFEKYGFFARDGFVKFVNNVYREDTNPEDVIYDAIDYGMVVIKRAQDGIWLDAPSENNGKEDSDFLLKHKL